VHGVPVQLVFANPIAVTGVNVYLRANPAKLISDPYRMGWLFEGKRPTDSDPRAGLLSGDQAVPWMEREVDRVSRFVHDQIARADCFVADGGAISTGFTQHLGRDQIIELCQARRDLPSHFSFESGSLETLMRIVDCTQSVTIIPEMCIDFIPRDKRDRVKPLAKGNTSRKVAVAVRRTYVKSSIIRALSDAIKRSIG
jgi:DNA-binding transcriptional LysR family regulator